MQDIKRISAGSFDLNKWLSGGYETDIITMIAGPPGSGKTNFSLLAACSLARKGTKVIFVDSEGGFSTERVKQIAPELYSEILENILLLNPMSFDEQKKCFGVLLKNLKENTIGLIVIDSISMLYRLELGDALTNKEDDKVKEVNREVAGQMRILAEIARKNKIPVIITTQVYNQFLTEEDFRNKVEPITNIVGGDLYKYWSKCIIELKIQDGKRRAVLKKHRSLPEKELPFEIKDKGIFKRSWI